MRLSNVILGFVSLGIVGGAAMFGCSSSDNTTQATSTGSTTSSTTSTSTSTTSTSSGACAPSGASCPSVASDCVAIEDNASKMNFGLRMSELQVTKPMALATGIVKTLVQGAVRPSDSKCAPALDGKATFNWLIQFDLAGKKVTTGGAKPVMDPTAGYSFVNETIMQGGKPFAIKPLTATVDLMAQADGSNKFDIAMGADVIVPIYLDAQAMSVVLLPLHDARLFNGQLSKDQNCIGQFNSAGLDPANMCLHDDMNPAFLTGGELEGYITVAEADDVEISQLSESLCALLTGSSDGGKPVAKCKPGAMGDYCSTTKMAGGCGDSFQLGAKFAASAVKIN